jgi:hypothetical protein
MIKEQLVKNEKYIIENKVCTFVGVRNDGSFQFISKDLEYIHVKNQDLNLVSIIETKERIWYKKIEKCIKSSTNSLQIQTCNMMLAQYMLKFPDKEKESESLQFLMFKKSEENKVI